MEVSPETPRRSIKIQGVEISVPAPFAEGHVVNGNESNVLNQTLAENLRNNLSTAVKEAVDKDTDLSDIQDMVDKYVESYEFGVRTGGGRTADPVMARAMSMARDKVKSAIKSKGLKISEVGAEQITKLAEDVLKKHPQIIEQARHIVELERESVEDLDIAV